MDTNSKVLLIAEDDDGNFFLLHILLKEFNCEIIRANNGLEAVNIFKSRNDISLIFMDIRMPVMNGMEASGIIRSLNRNIPIVIATAFAYDDDEKKVFEKNCEMVIIKPFTSEIINNIFFKYLNCN